MKVYPQYVFKAISPWLFCLFFICISLVTQAEAVIPPLTAHVTDTTQTLSASEIANLEQKLIQFEKENGSQVSVLIVPTTEPETIEQYGLRVVEAWKLGRKKWDDGVLLLIAKQDKAMRLEVGYGLEGAVPDVIAKRIVERTLTPHFKAGDFYGGIEAAIEQLFTLIRGENLPLDLQGNKRADDTFWLIFIMVGIVIIAVWLRVWLSPMGASGAASILGALVSWFVIPSLWVALAFAIIGFIVSLVVTGVQVPTARGNRRRWGYDGYSGGSSGWSSGGGNGGFGGGGGSFGGGGASGKW